MIYLGDEEAEECRGLLRLLSVLLSRRKSPEEKMEILETEFAIAMTQKLEEEMHEMGSFSDYIEREATKRGMKKGIEEGILGAIKNLIKNTDMTLEQIMKVLEIPDADREIYTSKLNALVK